MSGQVKYLKWITRDMLQAEPDASFVFGDNWKRVGMGGQAASMRGEPNAIGIATKRAPGIAESDFFSGTIGEIDQLLKDLQDVTDVLSHGQTVYVPSNGLGTGLSELPQRAPQIANIITSFFRACPGEPCPWEFI